MPSITAMRATMNLLMQIDLLASASPGSIPDRVLTGSNLAPICNVWTFGDDEGQINCFYFEEITLATGNNDYDLRSLLTDRPPAGTREFNGIKCFYLELIEPEAGAFVRVGGYGAGAWQGFLESTTATIKVDNKVLVPSRTGWDVSDGLQYLRIANPGDELTANLILLGTGDVALGLEPTEGFLILE